MRKSIIFNAEITPESVQELIESMEEFLLQDLPVDLYFSSDGGVLYAREILTRFLNDWKDQITLIGFGGLYSSGFALFHDFKGLRELVQECTGMVHIGTQQNDSRGLRNPDSYHSIMDRNLDYLNTQLYEQYKPFLTPTERKKFQKGEDLYFTRTRLKTIFKL